jgi:hypothetical protein
MELLVLIGAGVIFVVLAIRRSWSEGGYGSSFDNASDAGGGDGGGDGD